MGREGHGQRRTWTEMDMDSDGHGQRWTWTGLDVLRYGHGQGLRVIGTRTQPGKEMCRDTDRGGP